MINIHMQIHIHIHQYSVPRTPGTVSPDGQHGRISSPYVDIPATQPPMHISIDVSKSPSRSCNLNLKDPKGSPTKQASSVHIRDVHRPRSPRDESPGNAEDGGKSVIGSQPGGKGKGADAHAKDTVSNTHTDTHTYDNNFFSVDSSNQCLTPPFSPVYGPDLVPEQLFDAPPSMPCTPEMSESGTWHTCVCVCVCVCMCATFFVYINIRTFISMHECPYVCECVCARMYNARRLVYKCAEQEAAHITQSSICG
jgi:hypothetical protein